MSYTNPDYPPFTPSQPIRGPADQPSDVCPHAPHEGNFRRIFFLQAEKKVHLGFS